MKPPFTILPSADCAAKADLFLSLSALILGVFFWMHTLFVSSILISKDAMFHVAHMIVRETKFGLSNAD